MTQSSTDRDLLNISIPLDTFVYPDVPLPRVWSVVQNFETPALSSDEIVETTSAAIAELIRNDARLKPGASVAVGSGSRGLDNLVLVVKTVIRCLKEAGMHPFIIPAMGSHGGATAEGQESLLHDYGLLPEVTGAEIRATMDVIKAGTLEGTDAGPFEGHVVCYDAIAAAADAVILVNRIKPHTDFSSDIESGIGKMAAIGLGKRQGAEGIHHYGARGLRELMPRVARFLASNTNIVGGIALIENELGRTAEVHPMPWADMANDGERALLERARQISPCIPFDSLDVLVIDEMGKNISGCGMDTHVIGRGFMPSIPEHTWGGPNIRLLAVLDITDASHGNATALGLADITTRTLVEKIDFTAMLINMRTSGEGGVMRARLPLIMPTFDDCVRTAYATCGAGDPAEVRFARIRNTADTRCLEISEALLEEARSNPRLTVLEDPHALDLAVKVPLSRDQAS
jgi:hypothetical protein